MKLYQQLVLFMLAATVLPLALLGFSLLRSSERELSRRIGAEQRARATAVATQAGAALLEPVDAVTRATDAIDWRALTDEERRGALSLVYQQAAAVSAVVLIGPDGAVRAGPVHLSEARGGRAAFQPSDLTALQGALPLEPLRGGGKGQVALSPAYLRPLSGRGSAAALAVAVKLADGPESPFLLAELSLAKAEAAVAAEQAQGGGEVSLVDGNGRVLASAPAGDPLRSVDPALWAQAKGSLGQAPASQGRVGGARPQIVSVARLPGAVGLFALVSLEEHMALAGLRDLRRTVLGSLGAALGVLLLIGFAFTQRLNRRIAEAARGAEAFARGELGHRIPLRGGDELTGLSETFNRMGGELEAARARLTRWNDELRQKVEEATAELKAAQAQLVEAQKLAAVGQLGAGVAHEINNPLAGILGHTQLLLMERTERDPDFAALQKIELSAKRCKEITQNLLRFSQQRDRAELRPTDLNAVVRDALSLSQLQLNGEGIHVNLEVAAAPLLVQGDPAHLAQVLLALVSNARTAMRTSERKELRVRTFEREGAAVLEVKDSGKGIAPEHLPRIFEPFFTTKDVWSNVGLGLSVAYRMVSEHQGKIEVWTEPGQGAAFTVQVPRLVAAERGSPGQH